MGKNAFHGLVDAIMRSVRSGTGGLYGAAHMKVPQLFKIFEWAVVGKLRNRCLILEIVSKCEL